MSRILIALSVAAGTVLDSGRAPASRRRRPLEGMELAVVPTWTPATPEAGAPAA